MFRPRGAHQEVDCRKKRALFISLDNGLPLVETMGNVANGRCEPEQAGGPRSARTA